MEIFHQFIDDCPVKTPRVWRFPITSGGPRHFGLQVWEILDWIQIGLRRLSIRWSTKADQEWHLKATSYPWYRNTLLATSQQRSYRREAISPSLVYLGGSNPILVLWVSIFLASHTHSCCKKPRHSSILCGEIPISVDQMSISLW